MIGFTRSELWDIVGWILDEEDKIHHRLRRGKAVDVFRHECIKTMKEKIAVHTLRAPKSQYSDETSIMLEFSQEELHFIMEKAQYHADLTVRRMFDLGDGERARSICQKALRMWTEEVA